MNTRAVNRHPVVLKLVLEHTSIILLLLSFMINAHASVLSIKPIVPSNPVFNITKQTTFPIQFSLNEKVDSLQVRLMSGDDDTIKTFNMTKVTKGEHRIVWDGKDNDGVIVPDETYVPIFTAKTTNGDVIEYDPRQNSGGELLSGFKTHLNPNGSINFNLSTSARVLIRAGMRAGPLMNTIVSWEPRAKGANLQAWNGLDTTGVKRLIGDSNLRVLVIAYALPDASIITTGNTKHSYLDYRKFKGFELAKINTERIVSQRDGARISPYYFLPRSLAYEPEVLFSFLQDVKQNTEGAWVIDRPVNLKIDLSESDEWLLQQSQYEISFFVDNQFIAEEETGYTPLTWQWNPAGTSPGQHIFTVNISGLWGHVGVYNFLFEVPKRR